VTDLTFAVVQRGLLALALVGCACAPARPALRKLPEADLRSPAIVQWAVSASDPREVMLMVMMVAATLEQTEGECPVPLENQRGTLWLGGCEAADGKAWEGAAVISMSETEQRAKLHRFGVLQAHERCAEARTGLILDGKLRALSVDGTSELELELVVEEHQVDASCRELTKVYVAKFRGRSSAARGWSGVGAIGDSTHGKVELRVVDRRWDRQVCEHEWLAGRVELVAGDHRARVELDGARDCDPEQTATWALDGEAMGELDGVGPACRVGEGGPGQGLVAIGLLALAGVRRGSRSRSARARAAHSKTRPSSIHAPPTIIDKTG